MSCRKLLSLIELRHQFGLLSRQILNKRHRSGTERTWLCNHVRFVTTTWSTWKDAPQPRGKETETLDLDIWKSVMRSQTVHDEYSKDDATSKQIEKSVAGSPLDATRELVDMWRLAGKQVPDDITDEQLHDVAQLSTKSAKKKYLRFLALREVVKRADKAKKEKRKIDKLSDKQEVDDEGDEGSTRLRNSFVMQFWQRSLDKLLGWRCAQSMRFGQPLVYDMSYEQHMSRRELENTIKQLLEAEGCNRRSVEPFHLHFCNLNPEGSYQKEFLKRYGPETWGNLMITTSHQSYIDMFPREQLVYLTADSPNILRTFDHNKVYIIGALVDRSILPGVSLANAKRLKLATARLPLDEHLRWEIGAKNLSLDQMFRILMTVKETGNWTKALTFVPQRKHAGFHPAKNGDSNSGGVRASEVLPRQELNTLFLSKQKPRGLNSKSSTFSPKTTASKNNGRKSGSTAHSQTHLSKKNWWEEG